MGSSVCLHQLLLPVPITHNSPKFYTSQIFSPKSLTKLKRELLLSNKKQLRLRSHHAVVAVQSNFLKVLQKVWTIGKDGIKAGTDLVPDSIPRPIARIGVAGVALAVSLFLLSSFLSTAFFVVAMMGFIFFVYIALNKDDGPRGGGGNTNTEDSLEEARRIMEKYK